MSSARAVFLDRDGVINELVYYPDHGIVDSPFTAGQFVMKPHAGEALRKLREAGYRLVLVSNQPGIAKGNLTEEAFNKIARKMREQLAGEGITLDGEYYCFHHPEAKVASLRKVCTCRKPEPGLILQAAGELNLDLERSWMVGDGITDVAAGQAAGCRTVLVGRMKCELCQLMEEHKARPDAVCAGLPAAAGLIAGNLYAAAAQE